MQFIVENMACGGCVRSITKAIERVDPQARVDADPATRRVDVESAKPADLLLEALEAAGFPATVA
jgi:copper chaperone